MATNPTMGMFIVKSFVAIDEQFNHTTNLSCETCRPGVSIEVFFLAMHPPRPSKLFVRSVPDLGDSAFDEKPIVMAMVDDFFLIRVVMAFPRRLVTWEQKYDDYIYNPNRGILTRIPHPDGRIFYPGQVGLLPRGDQYTVAALVSKASPFIYELHLFKSEARSWKSKRLRVDPMLRKFPVSIPKNSSDIFHHTPSSVITLGGKSGTMGWVDLWRDILLCDLLEPSPVLRTVPLPLPMKQILSNEGRGAVLGFPKACRGIAYIEAERCLKFVEIQFDPSFDVDKTGPQIEKKVGWSVVISINTKMTDSWDDWDREVKVEAKDIKISSGCPRLISELHSHDDVAVAEPALQDFCVFQPGLSFDNQQVVYLLTSGEFRGDKTWVLALDLKNKTLVDVAEFDNETPLFSPVVYCHGSLSLFKPTSQGGA